MSDVSDRETSRGWFDRIILDLVRQLRWSFAPPLMVYFAAGLSGVTAIVGTFFVKEYLGLSAAFLSGLAFWAGIPWALKMPIGHLVDLIWRWKSLLIYLGAGLIGASIAIMYALITATGDMLEIMSIEAWFVLSALLAPTGYVLQDAVADAMSVEAVPRVDEHGAPLDEQTSKALHTTMQTLGRFALISGLVTVAAVNISFFSGIEQADTATKAEVYASIYLLAFLVPVVSVTGAILAEVRRWLEVRSFRERGMDDAQIRRALGRDGPDTEPDLRYLVGGLAFTALTLGIGLSDVRFGQEIVFAGSLAIVLFLMHRLMKELTLAQARALVGTATVIFVFRAVPLPGAGATWFQIDVLGFDQQFLSILSLIASVLTLVGMIVMRPLLARRRITTIIVLLTLAAGILFLPNIGLYYGIHNVTAPLTAGIVDARFIALVDTAAESPLGQIAMIPMLAWIARNAPVRLKATFFAVMASFTNLALSASSLFTKHLNQVFVVTREVRNRETGVVEVVADYSELGTLLITVALITVIVPLITVAIVQATRLHTND